MNANYRKSKKLNRRIFVLLGFIFAIPVFVTCNNRYEAFARFENPEKTHVLILLEDTWGKLLPTMPGQGGDVSGKVRLEDQRGKIIRQKKVALIRHLDLRRLEWSANSVSCIGLGEWVFDNKGSWDWD